MRAGMQVLVTFAGQPSRIPRMATTGRQTPGPYSRLFPTSSLSFSPHACVRAYHSLAHSYARSFPPLPAVWLGVVAALTPAAQAAAAEIDTKFGAADE